MSVKQRLERLETAKGNEQIRFRVFWPWEDRPPLPPGEKVIRVDLKWSEEDNER